MIVAMLALALVTGTPAPEAETLGRELAEAGTLTALLPVIQARETEQLVADHPELGAADQARLRAIAAHVFAAGRERLLSATGRAYADRLSVEELRQLVAFHRSSAARRYLEVTPAVVAASMEAMGEVDFAGDVRAAACREASLLCPREAR